MSATPEIEKESLREHIEILSQTPPFKGLTKPVLEFAFKNCEIRDYDEGQTVFSVGQYDGSEFFVIIDGSLRASRIDIQSGAVIVEEFGPNSVFGIELVFSEHGRELFQQLAVTAESDMQLAVIDTETFLKVASNRPSLMKNFAQYLADELSVRRFRAEQSSASPEQRVYEELIGLARREGVADLWRIEHMPKHREIAESADVEDNVAASAIAELIQEGVAQRDYPGLVICDMVRLKELSGNR